MATQEQIEQIVDALCTAPPKAFFQTMDETQAGIGAVLRFLSGAEGTVTAGRIAELMNVSTARVAVLLKKMVAKGLIIKEADPSDARITVVQLSEKGEKTAATIRANIHRQIGLVIDRIGMERMLEFAEVSQMIHQVCKHSPPADL